MWSVMAQRCLQDWFGLFDVHLDEGHRPDLDQPQQSDSDVRQAPFPQEAIWILYITVSSHAINLPRVFMSLSILKGYMGCKHFWCPSEMSLVIILGHQMCKKKRQREINSNLMPFYCVPSCVCEFVGREGVWHLKWWFVDKKLLHAVTETQPCSAFTLQSHWGHKGGQHESWGIQQSVNSLAIFQIGASSAPFKYPLESL